MNYAGRVRKARSSRNEISNLQSGISAEITIVQRGACPVRHRVSAKFVLYFGRGYAEKCKHSHVYAFHGDEKKMKESGNRRDESAQGPALTQSPTHAGTDTKNNATNASKYAIASVTPFCYVSQAEIGRKLISPRQGPSLHYPRRRKYPPRIPRNYRCHRIHR